MNIPLKCQNEHGQSWAITDLKNSVSFCFFQDFCVEFFDSCATIDTKVKANFQFSQFFSFLVSFNFFLNQLNDLEDKGKVGLDQPMSMGPVHDRTALSRGSDQVGFRA